MNDALAGHGESSTNTPWQVAFATFAHRSTQRRVITPLILSAAASLVIVAVLLPLAAYLVGEVGAAFQPWAERFFGNGYCRLIIASFLASSIYGILQLQGATVDRERLRLLGLPGGEAPASWAASLSGRPFRPHPGDPALWASEAQEDPHDSADRYVHQRQRYVELGLLPLRFSVWVLPLFGFIGTVVGIACSLDGLQSVVSPTTGWQKTDGLLAVLRGLRFAFDTTLLGLVTVIPVMLLHTVLDSREGDVTEQAHHRVLALCTSRRTGTARIADEQGTPPASHAGPLLDIHEK